MTTFHMIIGLPSSGMDGYARKIANEDMAVTYYALSDEIAEDMRAGRNVVLVTEKAMAHKYRRKVFAMIEEFDVEKTATLIATPFEQCLEWEVCVPEDEMRKMRENYVPPSWEEGFHNIWIVWNVEDFDNYSIPELFAEMNEFDQENENHEFTLGRHMSEASAYILNDSHISEISSPVNEATMLHDIGKLETKRFETMKGVPTESAHYYGHEGVGAYNAMFYLADEAHSDEMILDTCLLISLHMRVYFAKTPRAVNRIIRHFGKDVWANMQMINEADRAAH